MDKKLARKIDAYMQKHLAPWDIDEQGQPIEDCKALDVHRWLSDLMGEDLDKELEKEIRIECYKEALKADSTFFDDADKGYCPDSMVEGWGDVYLCKGKTLKERAILLGNGQDLEHYKGIEDDAYYLEDCTVEPSALYEVKRA